MKNILYLLIFIAIEANAQIYVTPMIKALTKVTTLDSADLLIATQTDSTRSITYYRLEKQIHDSLSKGDLTGGSGVSITTGTDRLIGGNAAIILDSAYWVTKYKMNDSLSNHRISINSKVSQTNYSNDSTDRTKHLTRKTGDSLYWKKPDTTSILQSQAKTINQLSEKVDKEAGKYIVDTTSLDNRIATKVDTSQKINGVTIGSGDINLTQDQITEHLITPGNRIRTGICFSDTFRIPSDTILAGGNRTLIRSYGTDTTVVIYWIEINYKYRTATYVSTGTDSMFIITKQNNIDYKVIYISDSYITGAYSGIGFFPVAIDKKNQGAAFRLYIPHIYTIGAGTLWLRIKYYLVVRKLT